MSPVKIVLPNAPTSEVQILNKKMVLLFQAIAKVESRVDFPRRSLEGDAIADH